PRHGVVLCSFFTPSTTEEVIMSSLGQQRQHYGDNTPTKRVPPAGSRPEGTKGARQAQIPPRKTWVWFLLALVANFFLMRLFMPNPDAPVTVPYTVFKEEVRKGNVKAIFSRGETITGRFKAPVTYPPANEESATPSGKPQRANERAAAPSNLP